MPIEKVVVNASPLITLFKSQLADLLPQLFGQVQVPPAVWIEVTASKDDIAAQMLPYSGWAIQTDDIAIHPLVSAWDLGAGESEVLSYALLHPSHTAIINDAAARRCAIGYLRSGEPSQTASRRIMDWLAIAVLEQRLGRSPSLP